MLPPGLRRAVLAFHLTVSVGWIGAVLAYLGLGVVASVSIEDAAIRGAWGGMAVIGWYVIAPLAVTALLSGLLLAAGTRWGILRHHWVIVSLVLTSVAVAVLLGHLPGVSRTAASAMTRSGPELRELGGDLPHAVGGLVTLLVVQVINVYKPRGVTRHGRRVAARSAAASAR